MGKIKTHIVNVYLPLQITADELAVDLEEAQRRAFADGCAVELRLFRGCDVPVTGHEQSDEVDHIKLGDYFKLDKITQEKLYRAWASNQTLNHIDQMESEGRISKNYAKELSDFVFDAYGY